MKTNELIEQVKAMGFEVEKDEPLKVITISLEDIFVAKIHYDSDLSFTTEWVAFDDLNYGDKLRLYNLLDAYARTPISQREDEPKHFYRLEGFKTDMNYINLKKTEKTLIISGKNESVFFKSQFTQSEINQMTPEQQKLFRIAVRERVDE